MENDYSTVIQKLSLLRAVRPDNGFRKRMEHIAGRQQKNVFPLFLSFRLAAILILAFFLSVTGIVATVAARPGDLLYPVKKTVEHMFPFTPSKSSREILIPTPTPTPTRTQNPSSGMMPTQDSPAPSFKSNLSPTPVPNVQVSPSPTPSSTSVTQPSVEIVLPGVAVSISGESTSPTPTPQTNTGVQLPLPTIKINVLEIKIGL